MSLSNNLNNKVNDQVYVATKKVSCNGIKIESCAEEGHPLVYLDMGNNDSVVCPYCSRLFTIRNKTSQIQIGINNKFKK